MSADQDHNIYECSICGYQYDPAVGDPERGIQPGTPFAELPDDWLCPLCGASKDLFNKLESRVPPPAAASPEVTKEYRNQDIIVYWNPKQCSHSGKCWQGLPDVFDPHKIPWVSLEGCSPEKLISIIDKCPSHALQYSLPEGSSVDPSLAKGPGSIEYKPDTQAAVKIRVARDGPLLVEGPVSIYGESGELLRESDCLVLCRCGKTQNPPFCDGSHLQKHG